MTGRRIAALIVLGLVFHLRLYAQEQKHYYVFICEFPPYTEAVSASASIPAWEEDTGIRITEDASKLIAKEFCDQHETILEYFGKHKLHDEQQRRESLDWVVQSYLYELRDKTIWAAPGASRARQMEGTVQNAFLQSYPGFPAEQIIGVPEVEHFAVANFLGRLSSVMQGNAGQGHLSVTSRPDRKSIEIDGVDKGNTCNKFVLSAGHHVVRAGSCKRQDIEILDGKTEHYSCPEKTDCPRPAARSSRPTP
jgi:hypothetical protein